MLKYYWIIIFLIIFAKFDKIRSLSSYNIKCILFYLIYVLWMFAEWDFEFDSRYFSIEEFIWSLFLVPLFVYLLFPFVYSHIKNWKIVKWTDRIIGSIYSKLKKIS